MFQSRKNDAMAKKDTGNELFKSADYSGALFLYTEGLNICPLYFKKERAIIFCNRAAAKIKLVSFCSCIK
jgi:regulator of replication initiation timing